MTEFFQTVMGHRFIEGTMPKLVEAIERLAKAQNKGPKFIAVTAIETNWGEVPRRMLLNADSIIGFDSTNDGVKILIRDEGNIVVKEPMSYFEKLLNVE